MRKVSFEKTSENKILFTIFCLQSHSKVCLPFSNTYSIPRVIINIKQLFINNTMIIFSANFALLKLHPLISKMLTQQISVVIQEDGVFAFVFLTNKFILHKVFKLSYIYICAQKTLYFDKINIISPLTLSSTM